MDIELPRTRVAVGGVAEVRLTVRNVGDRRLPPSLFITPVGGGTATFAVPQMGPGAAHRERFSMPTQRRQVLTIGPAHSSRGDAFGLFRRETAWTDTRELFVHPSTVMLDLRATGFVMDLEGLATDTLSSSDIAFHALREYEVGDDLRHVHWITSARVGKLMVRQFEETRRSRLVICLSMAPEDYATDDDFELACSVAASLALSAIRNNVSLTMRTPAGPLHTANAQRLLDDCARLAFGKACDPVALAAEAAARQAFDASVAVVVAGGEISASRINAALSRFSVDVRTSAIRCATGVGAARNSIGGAPVLTVGCLADLPSVVAVMAAA
jgi:uncharacterized protein (DUF58 family)